MNFAAKFPHVRGTDGPNRSDKTNIGSNAHEAAVTSPMLPTPSQMIPDPISAYIEQAEVTAGERLKNLQYNMEVLFLLRDHTHYYMPDSLSLQGSYLQSQFKESTKRAADAVCFSLNIGKDRLSGDMLSEVARAVASSEVSSQPLSLLILTEKLLSNDDPMVVDSMISALEDYEPHWFHPNPSIKSAISQIPWPDIRTEAEVALNTLED